MLNVSKVRSPSFIGNLKRSIVTQFSAFSGYSLYKQITQSRVVHTKNEDKGNSVPFLSPLPLSEAKVSKSCCSPGTSYRNSAAHRRAATSPYVYAAYSTAGIHRTKLLSFNMDHAPIESPQSPPVYDSSLSEGNLSMSFPKITALDCNPKVESFVKRVDSLINEMLVSNWADCYSMVVNAPFWDDEKEQLVAIGQELLHIEKVCNSLKALRRIFDLLTQVEDVRDHLNEVIEQRSRSSGIAGVGLFAHPYLGNPDDHANAAKLEYDRLIKTYPEYSRQIDSTVGTALALYRQKHKYQWQAMHSFFY